MTKRSWVGAGGKAHLMFFSCRYFSRPGRPMKDEPATERPPAGLESEAPDPTGMARTYLKASSMHMPAMGPPRGC